MPGIVNNAQSFGVSIANGQSLSGALDLGNLRAARISMPGAIDGTVLTFQVLSGDPAGNVYNNLYNADGTEYVVQMGASRDIVLNLPDWLSIPALKIRTGTSAAATVQTANRTLYVTLAPYNS